jgi:general secretion pathway protein G
MNSRAFTLIELAVGLAVIGVLAAVLTPIAMQYVEETRLTRAHAEAKTIATAIMLHTRDTGRYPVYDSLSHPTTDIEILFGDGNEPGFVGGDWFDGFTPTDSLHTRLNTNFFNLPTTTVGRVVYRGPYTTGIPPDPWGNLYVAEVGTAPSALYAAFVLSAGPDGIVHTQRIQHASTFSVAGDDIVVRIK